MYNKPKKTISPDTGDFNKTSDFFSYIPLRSIDDKLIEFCRINSISASRFTISFSDVSVDDVAEVLQKIQSEAYGDDGLNMRMLTNLINTSFRLDEAPVC